MTNISVQVQAPFYWLHIFSGARGRSDYHGVAEQEKSVQDNGLQSGK